MSIFHLAWRSFLHYFRRNLPVIAGIALSTAVLTGALFIGDSMRFSLERIALARLGNITSIVSVSDRYFLADLAVTVSGKSGLPVAPVLMANGSATTDGGLYRVNNVQFIGVDNRFEPMSGSDIFNEISDDEIIINENLAHRLEITEGEFLLLRIAKASVMPRNTPFVSEGETTVALRAKIRRIANREQMGYFNLRNSQTTPHTVFLSLDRLNRLMEFENRANRLLISGEIPTEQLKKILDCSLQPEDVGLVYQHIQGTGESEVSSERIFMDEQSVGFLSDIPGSRKILTYFVNSIQSGGHSVPYSFASAWNGLPLSDREIILNDWAADDLGIEKGDTVNISYFEIGPLRRLTEKSLTLTVKEVVPGNGIYGDRDLMPRIPGLSDAGHCREWEAGIPVQLDKIRDKDEAYWNQFRGTPKAFISGTLARQIWANRFGEYTAIRYPAGDLSETRYRELFTADCHAEDWGFSIRAVRTEGLEAAGNGVDFGQLFLGLSFFLLLSAILLTAMLFRFNLENRENQTETLLKLGFPGKQIRNIYLSEALFTAIPAVIAGLILAVFYVKLIFLLLNTLWWDIVRAPVIFLKIVPSTLVSAALVSLLISLVSVWMPLNRYLRHSIQSLQKRVPHKSTKPDLKILRLAGLIFLIGGTGIVLFQLFSQQKINPGLFFLSGGSLLAAMLLLFRVWLNFPDVDRNTGLNSSLLWRRTLKRNPGRAMSIVTLFATGTFLVIATGANRQNALSTGLDKQSGTGGFGYFAETAVPVLYDLNDPERRLSEGLDTAYQIIQMSKIEGDDASCLNLNLISNPSILGCRPADLLGRFSFQSFSGDIAKTDPWKALQQGPSEKVVPAIADQTVIQWGLGMKVGDTLTYQAETGDTLRLKLIAGLSPSIFQGNVLIDQAEFQRYYPSHSGSSVFLIDSWDETVREELSNHLRDNGIDIIVTPQRLSEFSSVTNTYLSIFFALGILGLAIGTIGVSVVVARTLIERKRELAIMLATGFHKKEIVSLLIKEYAFLLIAGLTAGFISAVIPLFPVLSSGNNPFSAGTILLIVTAVAINGLFWIVFFTNKWVNTGNILTSLSDL